jgi:hypothetical protein
MQAETISYVSLGIAVFGACLSLFNSWRAFSNDRVKIRIRPSWALRIDGTECLLVEVVNLSTFPVTISHVGLTLRGGKHIQLSMAALLPKLLEPRTNLTVLAPAHTCKDAALHGADKVYVSTACGLTIKGGRKGLAIALHNLSLAGKKS